MSYPSNLYNSSDKELSLWWGEDLPVPRTKSCMCLFALGGGLNLSQISLLGKSSW